MRERAETPRIETARAETSRVDREPLEAALPATLLLPDDGRETRVFRRALVAAAIAHALLFLLELPKNQVEAQAEPKREVFVVMQTPRPKPRPPEPTPLPPIERRRIAVPDQTPDDPEPIATDLVLEPSWDFDPSEVVIDLPAPPPPPEPEVSGPMLVSGDVVAPRILERVQPQYTEMARRARIQGIVILQAVIDRSGRLTDAKVLKGLPLGLDEASLEAVQQWRFEPARLGEKPVAVYWNLTVTFQLQ